MIKIYPDALGALELSKVAFTGSFATGAGSTAVTIATVLFCRLLSIDSCLFRSSRDLWPLWSYTTGINGLWEPALEGFSSCFGCTTGFGTISTPVWFFFFFCFNFRFQIGMQRRMRRRRRASRSTHQTMGL